MSSNIVAQNTQQVNSLDDRPILVILPNRCYWLDMTDDQPIPFQGEPQYGQYWDGSPEDWYGLEARG
jgi:hypothetical protein